MTLPGEMQGEVAGPFAPYLAKKRQWLKGLWQKELRFETVLFCVIVLLFAVAIWAIGRPNNALSGMSFLYANLPLTLPVLTVVLTVLLRPTELTRFDGWLRLATPFGLGLVSFAIWAYVAGQSVDQYIEINSTKVLNKNHALLLVIISFILASSYSVVNALAETSTKKRPWQIIQAVQFAISCALLTLPFFLFEDKKSVESVTGHSFDERYFTVDIPFRDAVVNTHLGTTNNPITQCFSAAHVKAKSPSDAIRTTLGMMKDTHLTFPKDHLATPPEIEVLDNISVAQEER
jgi:hypothetical protein